MPFKKIAGGGTIITGAGSIELFRLICLRAALQLETKGIRMSRGRTAYSVLKAELKLRGSKASVLQQVNLILERYYANPGAQEVQ